MPALGRIGNNTLTQIALYQLVGQLLGAVLGPYSQAITNRVNALTPLVPLSPAELAALVERGELPLADAASQARESGIDGGRFALLTRLYGQAPGPMELSEALRRGIIDPPTYERGIVQGTVRREWAGLFRALAIRQPPPDAMLLAYLEGQLPEAEARARFVRLGGDPDYFDILYNTQGQAPTPVQALELANRGIIPWAGRGPAATTYEQAFLEGPWRNKWLPAFRALGEYLPPPRTVTAMYREGSIDRRRAADLLTRQGLAADLAEAYLNSGSAQRTEKGRDLSQSTILGLYGDRLIPRADARTMLTGLRYEADEADLLLDLEDAQVARRYLNLAVGRVRSLYVGHKLDRAEALSVLARLGLDPDGSGDLVAIWDWERAANVRALTSAEVRAAFHYQIIDQADASRQLVELGMSPYDAWVYLSIGEKGPLGGQPAPGDIGPGPLS